MATAFHTLTVAAVEALCDDAAVVTFAVPETAAGAFVFRPGQSLTLRRVVDGREQRRSYSICSPSGSPLRIGVRQVPGGTFSPWLVRHVRAGDEVEAAAPTGRFTPDRDPAGHHVLVAAGSGITPILSIVASVLAHPAATATLLYGNRRSDTVMFADELADLKDRHPARLELVHVLSREPGPSELLSGRLDADRVAALLGAIGDPAAADHWWLCGPLGMVADVRSWLEGRGVPAARVHNELFYVEDVPPEPALHRESAVGSDARQVTIVLDGRSTTLPLDPATTVLAGAQASRPDVPFACKGGVCGTCRARVTRGVVDMRRNFALEPAEVDAGFVLTCQSFASSTEVTVDYDA